MTNTVTFIDMNKYARKEQFEHFRSMTDPYAGVTVNVDVTELAAQCQKKGKSFTLAFLHLAALAADDVPELRQRIRGERIAEYTQCPTSHIELLPNGAYCYCTVYHHDMGWQEYFAAAEKAQRDARTAQVATDGDDVESLYFVSCMPWLHYSDLKEPTDNRDVSNPRIFWGGYEEDWKGRKMMPVTLHAHHSLVDGYHIGQFFLSLNRRLAEVNLSELPDKKEE